MRDGSKRQRPAGDSGISEGEKAKKTAYIEYHFENILESDVYKTLP